MTPDAYAVYYQQATWFDNPPVRHGDGVVGFLRRRPCGALEVESRRDHQVRQGA